MFCRNRAKRKGPNWENEDKEIKKEKRMETQTALTGSRFTCFKAALQREIGHLRCDLLFISPCTSLQRSKKNIEGPEKDVSVPKKIWSSLQDVSGRGKDCLKCWIERLKKRFCSFSRPLWGAEKKLGSKKRHAAAENKMDQSHGLEKTFRGRTKKQSHRTGLAWAAAGPRSASKACKFSTPSKLCRNPLKHP